MDDDRRRAIEADCQRLMAEFAFAVDAHDADGVARTFAVDGLWHHQGHAFIGREAIRRAVVERQAEAPAVITRHHYGATAIRVIDATHAEARTYYAVYRHEGNGDLTLPRPLQATRIGEYFDTFVPTAEGWKFASKRAMRVLEQR
jgi:uncharacterized protein (TIGR02246 family)